MKKGINVVDSSLQKIMDCNKIGGGQEYFVIRLMVEVLANGVRNVMRKAENQIRKSLCSFLQGLTLLISMNGYITRQRYVLYVVD